MRYYQNRDFGGAAYQFDMPQDVAFKGSITPQNVQSFNIGAVVLDWDGTVQDSYATLMGVEHLREALTKHLTPQKAAAFLNDLVKERSFQGVLHGRSSTKAFFDAFVTSQRSQLNEAVARATLEVVESLHERAFKAYPGVQAFLDTAKQAGVPVFIYTNTSGQDIMKRMWTAGISPENFAAIYAKHDANRPPFDFVAQKTGAVHAAAFLERVILYKDYKKPAPVPLLEISKVLGINHKQLLMVGEGMNDALIVFGKDAKAQPIGHFAFHAQGARDICARTSAINETLRPGAEPLGHDHVVKGLADRGLQPGLNYIYLDDGFRDVNKMVESTKITYSRPAHRAKVSEGQLMRATAG